MCSAQIELKDVFTTYNGKLLLDAHAHEYNVEITFPDPGIVTSKNGHSWVSPRWLVEQHRVSCSAAGFKPMHSCLRSPEMLGRCEQKPSSRSKLTILWTLRENVAIFSRPRCVLHPFPQGSTN